MTQDEIKKLNGKKVLVAYKGLLLTGKFLGISPEFGGRDALIKLPGENKPRKFWHKKVSEIK
jgi:hypothetical protein